MVEPKVFGPSNWKTIHNIALGYPMKPSETDKVQYRRFFELMGDVLPCDICSKNYKKHFKELSIDTYLDTRENLFKWTYLLHNMVNKELKKKEIKYEDAIYIYTNNTNYEYYLIIGLCILVILVIFLIILQYMRKSV
jgi:hypothetical protein